MLSSGKINIIRFSYFYAIQFYKNPILFYNKRRLGIKMAHLKSEPFLYK